MPFSSAWAARGTCRQAGTIKWYLQASAAHLTHAPAGSAQPGLRSMLCLQGDEHNKGSSICRQASTPATMHWRACMCINSQSFATTACSTQSQA